MDMMLLAAACSGFVTFAVHTWLGGPRVAGPLLRASDLPEIPKYINYGCWHGMTISLFFVATAFAWAAYDEAAIELAWFAFLYNAAFLVWSVGLVLWKKQSFLHIPHWVMFGATTILGGLALLAP